MSERAAVVPIPFFLLAFAITSIGVIPYALVNRGAALPAPLIAASLILGVVWSLWHLPLVLAQGGFLSELFETMPLVVCFSVIFTWFYQRTGGSMRIAVLAHLGIHLDNVSRSSWPAQRWLTTAVAAVAAIAIAIRDPSLGRRRLV